MATHVLAQRQPMLFIDESNRELMEAEHGSRFGYYCGFDPVTRSVDDVMGAQIRQLLEILAMEQFDCYYGLPKRGSDFDTLLGIWAISTRDDGIFCRHTDRLLDPHHPDIKDDIRKMLYTEDRVTDWVVWCTIDDWDIYRAVPPLATEQPYPEGTLQDVFRAIKEWESVNGMLVPLI